MKFKNANDLTNIKVDQLLTGFWRKWSFRAELNILILSCFCSFQALHAQTTRQGIYDELVSSLKEKLSQERVTFEVSASDNGSSDLSIGKMNESHIRDYGETEIYMDLDSLEATTIETKTYIRRVSDTITVDIIRENEFCRISLSKYQVHDILINLSKPEIIIEDYELVHTTRIEVDDTNNIFNSAWIGLQWQFQNNLKNNIFLTTGIIGDRKKLYLNIQGSSKDNSTETNRQVRLIELW